MTTEATPGALGSNAGLGGCHPERAEDRVLLGLAGAVADCGVRWEVDYGCYSVPSAHGPRRWNPPTDDGDALRLAVTLGITMYPSEGKHDGATTTWAHPDSEWIVVERTADPGADMRRAIVLAAAAMSKTPNVRGKRVCPREEQR